MGKSGVSIARALKIRDDGVMRLRDCYSAARSFGLTSEAMEARRRDVLQRSGIDKAPQWVRAYLDGYWRAIITAAYERDLVYGAIFDGEFRSTHRDRADYYEKHGMDPRAYAGANPTKGHYWRSYVDFGRFSAAPVFR